MRRRRWSWLLTLTLLGMVSQLLNPTAAMALQVGDKAPDFSLPSTTAERISLTDFVGKQPVVVFFYLYAFTGG